MILVVKEERSVIKMPKQKSGNGRRVLATNIRKMLYQLKYAV